MKHQRFIAAFSALCLSVAMVVPANAVGSADTMSTAHPITEY